MSAILNCVGKAQLSLLMRCSTSSEMWVRLRDTYLLKSEVTIARLETELSNLKWRRNTSIEEFISEIDHIVNLIRGCG